MQAIDCEQCQSLYFVHCCINEKAISQGSLVYKTQTSHRVEAELQVSSDDFALSSTVQHLYNESDPVSVKMYYLCSSSIILFCLSIWNCWRTQVVCGAFIEMDRVNIKVRHGLRSSSPSRLLHQRWIDSHQGVSLAKLKQKMSIFWKMRLTSQGG